MSEMRQSLIQLNRTGVWVPRAEAKRTATTVYFEFSMNIGNIEDMSILSHLIHADFEPQETKKYLSDDLEERLVSKNYLAGTLGELASRLTLKSHMTSSMVVAELDDSNIGGYLVEPFVGKDVLPELYDIYRGSRRRPITD